MPPIKAGMRPLPIDELREPLRRALREHNRFVVHAPTGSGKSTRLPQFLLDDGLAGGGQVVVLQPRRLPTRMLAKRVAEERGVPLGSEVGYQIRLDSVAGPQTRLKYVTEGLLLRQMLGNPELPGVGAVLFDEFHERHLHGDLSLALACLVQRRRPDLVLGVMSATLDTDALEAFLRPCAVLRSEGRMFPVAVSYAPAPGPRPDETPVWEQAARVFRDLARETAEGDCLVFMPGAYEISRTLGELEHLPEARGWALHSLHGELPPEQQDAAVAANRGQRKVIVSTNVAETALTIDGVRLVIDAGLARQPAFDPHRGINTLLVQKISRASAEQRAGRAGRTAPGRCVRLWSERDHQLRPAREVPEVRRLDLAESVLSLAAGGFPDAAAFPWFEAPDEAALARAARLLRDLGALDVAGRVTPLGRRLAALPLHPRYGRLLLAGHQEGVLDEAALVCALSQGRPVLLPPEDRAGAERAAWLPDDVAAESDFFLDLEAVRRARERSFDLAFCRHYGVHAQGARQAWDLARQLAAQARGLLGPGPGAPPEAALARLSLRRAVLAGFADQVARRLDRATFRCALVHGRKGELRRQTRVQEAPLLVAAEIEERDQRGDVTVLLSQNTAVEERWLEEIFPETVVESARTVYESGQKRVVVRRERAYHDLVLASRETGEAPPESEAAALLAAEVRAGRLELKGWDEPVETWIARVNFLARHCADYGFAPIGDEDRQLLVEQLCLGCVSARDLREKDPWPALRSWLPQGTHHLVDELAPERVALPKGYRAPVTYAPDGSRATLAATVQQLYDAPGKILLAGGRAAATIEILAPNRRPVQIATNLDDFWRSSYAEVKKQLKGRYPKHEWR